MGRLYQETVFVYTITPRAPYRDEHFCLFPCVLPGFSFRSCGSEVWVWPSKAFASSLLSLLDTGNGYLPSTQRLLVSVCTLYTKGLLTLFHGACGGIPLGTPHFIPGSSVASLNFSGEIVSHLFVRTPGSFCLLNSPTLPISP